MRRAKFSKDLAVIRRLAVSLVCNWFARFVLLAFIRQNNNQLGRRRRENEFELTDAEVTAIETIVAEEFEGYPDDSH